MEEYRDMYLMLFNKITDIIQELKEIQLQAEELFINISENSTKK